jgi:hypothetical protein
LGAISNSKLKTKTYMKAIKDPKMYCFILLVLISGDVDENPGPVNNPCGKCERPVQSNQRGIQCEDCMFWHHIKCIEMTVSEYNSLSISTDSWYSSIFYRIIFWNEQQNDKWLRIKHTRIWLCPFDTQYFRCKYWIWNRCKQWHFYGTERGKKTSSKSVFMCLPKH